MHQEYDTQELLISVSNLSYLITAWSSKVFLCLTKAADIDTVCLGRYVSSEVATLIHILTHHAALF